MFRWIAVHILGYTPSPVPKRSVREDANTLGYVLRNKRILAGIREGLSISAQRGIQNPNAQREWIDFVNSL